MTHHHFAARRISPSQQQQRVLHLIDPGSPGGGACTLHLLAEVMQRLTSLHHDAVIIGTRRHLDLAQRCGVEPLGHLCVPPLAGGRTLRRLLDTLESARGPYRIVHAWTARAAVLATLAAPQLPRLATLHVGPVSGLQTHTLIRLLSDHRLPILAASAAVQREYLSLGVPRREVSLLPPAVNPQSIIMTDRQTVRKRWAEDHQLDDQTFIVGLLCEPVSWPDAMAAVNVAARVALSGRRIRLVMHHAAAHRVEAEQYLRRMDMDDLIIVDDNVAEPWRMVAGLDAALLLGGDANARDLSTSDAVTWMSLLFGGGRRLRPVPSVLPLLWAFAAGVPVIAEDNDASRAILHNEGVSGMLIDAGDINAACDRITRLYDDRTIAGRVGGSETILLNSVFHISAYCVRLRQAYDQLLANRPVRVIDEPDDPIVELAGESAMATMQA